MRAVSSLRVSIVLVAIVLASPPARAQTPIHFETGDNDTSLSIGVLAQGVGEIGATDGQAATGELYFRRLRLIAGGAIIRRVRFFVDTDTPYLGHTDASGWAATPTILQDAFATIEAAPWLQFDAGLMLVPVSYNTTQSAASLLAIGYGAYSFLAATPTHSRTGRDQGIEARGYLAGNTIEYRVGTFRGAEKIDDALPLRYAARVVYYPFGAQTGFFYTGTQLGKRRLAGIGASVDHQDRYHAYGGDAFLEWPFAGGSTLTVQADVTRYDGGATFKGLPRQLTWMVEAGCELGRSRIEPFVQVSRQDITSASSPDARVYQAGAIYWAKGHRLNVKAGAGRSTRDRTADRTQVMVQAQVFVY